MDSATFVMANAFRETREMVSMKPVEDKLWMMIIARVRKAKDASKEITLHASEYQKQYGGSIHAAYRALKDGSRGLVRVLTEVNFDPRGEGNHFYLSNWIQDITYHDGMVTVMVTRAIVAQVKGQTGSFTKFDLQGAADLKGRYALRLYRYLASVKAQKRIELTLEEFKTYMGVKGEYEQIGNLKLRVLDPALKEINAKSDLRVSKEDHKPGRAILGFKFKVKTAKKSPARSTGKRPIKAGTKPFGRERISHADYRRLISYARAEKLQIITIEQQQKCLESFRLQLITPGGGA